MFVLWCRLLEEEAAKRAELEQIHLRQQQAISQTQAEKEELERKRLAKEGALQAAMQQLQQLESERQGALEQYEVLHMLLALCVFEYFHSVFLTCSTGSVLTV